MNIGHGSDSFDLTSASLFGGWFFADSLSQSGSVCDGMQSLVVFLLVNKHPKIFLPKKQQQQKQNTPTESELTSIVLKKRSKQGNVKKSTF